jgi:2-oxo-3-hexenedioate decarboxylase
MTLTAGPSWYAASDSPARCDAVAHLKTIADALIAAYDTATTLPPITSNAPDFSVADGYAVLLDIEQRRRAQGWRPIGRKIGFTNRTIWPRYGVYEPIWATMWSHTVHFATDGQASLSLQSLVQPRIEPEVVLKLKAPLPPTDEPLALLAAAEWIAPGFEIVQSHFPDWKFKAADCTAAFGLHGALVIGTPVAIDDSNKTRLASALPAWTVTLSCGGHVIDRGVGTNVLDGPLLALTHLARLLASRPHSPALAAGEIVTTGTITDAWPVAAEEIWSSDYGALGLSGLTLRFTVP